MVEMVVDVLFIWLGVNVEIVILFLDLIKSNWSWKGML